ncbi:MAG TPA: hypothetical protein DEB40_04470 [Elusimicrobia bacterium]|nr:hypothetical protein [Elusimicrobiota bacterium]
MLPKTIASFFLFSAASLAGVLSARCAATGIIIVGDIQYQPIAAAAADVESTLKVPLNVFSTAQVKGKLRALVRRENAGLVVALGREALEETLQLPPSISVVFGLVIAPPKTSRPNTTGVYLATPVREYVNIAKKYLPAINKIAILGSPDMINILDSNAELQGVAYRVSSCSEIVDTINRMHASDALLLLPDTALLTAGVMDQLFLFSFRKRIPLLGVSEGSVKNGALLALVFDSASVGRQIGEKVLEAQGGAAPPSAPRKFNLYINANTAMKMGIIIPEEMIKTAKNIYR